MNHAFHASPPLVTISVVSHGQADLVQQLLTDIGKYCHSSIEVILTLNVPENIQDIPDELKSKVLIIRNKKPKGFGANHNAAFQHAHGNYFCLLNPDIRFNADPLPELLNCLSTSATATAKIAIVAPLIKNRNGDIEDSARPFPTPLGILGKVLHLRKQRNETPAGMDLTPDWVGGMYMLLPVPIYRELGGFDERYFLYYEDVDLCARARLAGYEIRLCPEVSVVHEARRQSHRNVRYLRWHVTSLIRFFLSMPYLRIRWYRLLRRPLP